MQGHPASLALLLLLSAGHAAVIQRIFGANNSEVSFASSGGGTHVYLAGTGMCAHAEPDGLELNLPLLRVQSP